MIDSALAQTRRLLEAGVARDRERGVQLTSRREDARSPSSPSARRGPGVPMRPDTLAFWISMTKPVVGVAYGLLLERGLPQTAFAFTTLLQGCGLLA